ncbi:aminotransferase class V-fold PLP-dependent enzyme, partial [Intestinibacillus massiliensis]|nr:aminotransferase class V-fold PLP-dependent enzyme [Intestinibacillus massiliensis]
PDVSKIEELIKANPKVKVVAMVCHETSTGMINPVKEVGQLCKKYNKWYFVDCVSAAAGEYIDIVDFNITFATSVSEIIRIAGRFFSLAASSTQPTIVSLKTAGLARQYCSI